MANTAPELTLDLTKYIDNSLFRGGHPHVRGHRIRVAWIVEAASDNQMSIAALAYNFSLSEAEILAALLYYQEHKDTIDALEETEHEAHKHHYEN